MAKKELKPLLAPLIKSKGPLSLIEIRELLPEDVPPRTIRRWLSELITCGVINRSGKKRGTTYSLNEKRPITPGFAADLDETKKNALLKEVRDKWSHSSTAIEGNTLSLGETHGVLEEGLTISGKPITDHQEVIGHARAIDIIYQSIHPPVSEELCFNLHKAVQTDLVFDIDKPYGAYKVVVNGTYIVIDEKAVYLEYAHPRFVKSLMNQIINEMNNEGVVSLEEAPTIYAKYHAAMAHVHPFWDGNGRIARLLANVPLLKNHLFPLLIPNEERVEYKRLLGEYEISVGAITDKTGPWPDMTRLQPFINFCERCYQENKLQFGRYIKDT